MRGDPDQEGVSDEESAANGCVFSPAIKANVMTATIARIFFRVFIVMVIFLGETDRFSRH